MMKVLGRNTSSNVQIVMWALAELGLKAERLDYGHSYGGTDTPEYRALNPNGLVPVFQDDDLTLWESGAILRYLGAKYGDEAFWPRDPAVRARLDMWAEWSKTTLAPAFNYGVFFPMVRFPPSKRDPEVIGKAIEDLKPVIRRLDERIGEGPFLAGEHLSFADIMAGHLLYRYYTVDFDRTETPALDAWYERLSNRAAYRENVMISYEPLRVTEG